MTRIAAFLVALLAAWPAAAHHPLGGAPMTGFADGLLSGLGHPLLGFEHLFFVLALGLAARISGRPLTAPLIFILLMAGGVLLTGAGYPAPLVEPLIALSLLLLGLLLMRGRRPPSAPIHALFALAGLVHGAAFGAALAGVEGDAATAVTLGYLVGLSALQWALAVGFGLLAHRAGAVRLPGAAVAGIGAFLLLEAAEGTAFAALGFG